MKTLRPRVGFALILLALAGVAGARPWAKKVWVVFRPVQCMGNPWEKEWLAKNNNEGSKFPRDKEFVVLRDYFARKGVQILEIRERHYVRGEALCQTCDCPRGDTVYLKINADDAPKMVNLGYTERAPATEAEHSKKKK
jgi:hypothetical protein